jgi:hypothetical protein
MWTDGQDEANSRTSQFFERASKQLIYTNFSKVTVEGVNDISCSYFNPLLYFIKDKVTVYLL